MSSNAMKDIAFDDNEIPNTYSDLTADDNLPDQQPNLEVIAQDDEDRVEEIPIDKEIGNYDLFRKYDKACQRAPDDSSTESTEKALPEFDNPGLLNHRRYFKHLYDRAYAYDVETELQYREPIGSGGNARVFKTKGQEDNQVVAMKEISIKFKDEAAFHSNVFQAMDEAKVHADLQKDQKHQNIVAYHGVFVCPFQKTKIQWGFKQRDDPESKHRYDIPDLDPDSITEGSGKNETLKCCIVIKMQYCNKGSLATYVSELGKMDLRLLKDNLCIFLQVLDGVMFLLANGVVHHDLKLENILMHDESNSGKPTPKICDFGGAGKEDFGETMYSLGHILCELALGREIQNGYEFRDIRDRKYKTWEQQMQFFGANEDLLNLIREMTGELGSRPHIKRVVELVEGIRADIDENRDTL